MKNHYNYKRIQNNIKILLAAHDETQKSLARSLDVTERQVNTWVKGKTDGTPVHIPTKRIEQIATHFNVSVASLTETSLSDDIGQRLNDLQDIIKAENALIKYYETLGVRFEYIGLVKEKDDKTIIDRPRAIKMTWVGIDGIEQTRIVKTAKFEAFAREMNDFAMLHIKHIY